MAKSGDVDITITNKTWEALHPNLQAEMIRDCMGRISSSTFELSHAVGCVDGEKTQKSTRTKCFFPQAENAMDISGRGTDKRAGGGRQRPKPGTGE
jgi:hypothetical protein